jgi:hypothetical protein
MCSEPVGSLFTALRTSSDGFERGFGMKYCESYCQNSDCVIELRIRMTIHNIGLLYMNSANALTMAFEIIVSPPTTSLG